ncbi:MAG: hypothetical protein Q7S62_03015 [bacterium]|nr:hypothetical protein [bacterium]
MGDHFGETLVSIAIFTNGSARLVACYHLSNIATPGTFLVRGRILAVAVVANCSARRVAHCHLSDITTPGTFLVHGNIFAVAIVTDYLAGPTVSMKISFGQSAGTANPFNREG